MSYIKFDDKMCKDVIYQNILPEEQAPENTVSTKQQHFRSAGNNSHVLW